MEYYAYWNGDQIVAILNAIAGITNSQSFTGLLRVAGVFGLMAAVVGAMFRQKFADAWSFFLVFTLIYMGLVVPKVTVNVVDVRGGTAVPVANVPLGIGVFGSELSHIGKWLTETYETAFSPADDVARFGRFGIIGPQRLINAAATASLDTPVVKANLTNLMKDCVIPELIDQPQMVAQFGASANVWGLIGTGAGGGGTSWLNPARLTMVQQPISGGSAADVIRGTGALETVPKTCVQAYNIIDGQVDLAVNTAINAIASRELPLNSTQSQTPASPGALSAAGSYIKARVEGANALLTGVSSTTELLIKQRATLDALGNGIDASNPMAASIGQAVGVGNLSAAINYRAMPQIAQDALPKLRNSVEMLVIAAFPIMVVIMLVAGLQGLPLFKGYLVMMLWTQLWAPLFAVVNFMMISADASPYTALINAYGAQSAAAMSLITQLGASSQDTAGMLSLAIPMIALALAKGGEMALTSMASTVMSPATSAAQSSGSQLAQGNTSLGNVSWGNVTEGNSSQFNRTMGSTSVGQGAVGTKADGSNSVRFGNAGTTALFGAAGSVTTDGKGGELFQVPSSQTGAVGASVTGANSLGNGSSSARGAQAGTGTRAEIQTELGNALRDATSTQASRAFTQAFQNEWNKRQTGEAGTRSVGGERTEGGAALTAESSAAERVTLGGSVRSDGHVGNVKGGRAGGTTAPSAGTSNAPGKATTPTAGQASAAPAPSATTRAGTPIPPPGSRESEIPPALRGSQAPPRPNVDPDSPKAQVPPGSRIEGYATGTPQGAPTGAAPGGQRATTGAPTVPEAAAAAATNFAQNTPAMPSYGGSVEASTAIADAARRTMAGNGTQQDERILAAATQAARAMQYTSGDRSTQEAGMRLEAALTRAVASRGSETASVEQTARADESRTSGATNQAAATLDRRHDIPEVMRSMNPQKYSGLEGTERLARDMQKGSPEAVAAAQVIQASDADNLGTSHPSLKKLEQPESPGAILGEGAAAVAATQERGNAAALAANAGAQQVVTAAGPGVSPTSVANPNGLPAEANGLVANASEQTAAQGRETAMNSGMTQFAAAQYRQERESGSEPLMLMLRTMGFGAGYHAPQETAAAMQALRPHMSSEGQAFFENLGRTSAQTGGQISSEQLQQGMGHLQSAARARDQQDVPKEPNATAHPGA